MTGQKARATLFTTILVGVSVSSAILLYKGMGGSLVAPAMTDAFEKLVQFYLPMLLVIATFYFAEKKKDAERLVKPQRSEAYVVGTILVTIWAALPIVALLMSTDYQSAFFFLGAFRGYGDGVANAALVYCFLKTA